MLTAHLAFELRTREVLAASAAETRQLGPHFMVGFSSFPEVARLDEQGLIGGIYISRHNIHRVNLDLNGEAKTASTKQRSPIIPRA
jgi:beta-N-acetylhexosaminidase